MGLYLTPNTLHLAPSRERREKKMKKVELSILSVLVAAAFCLQARGANLEVEVADMATISSADTTRFLLQFDLPADLEGCTIDYAHLLFTAQADSGWEEPLDIAGYRVATGWDMGSVSWVYPWINPGGDYNDSSLTLFTISGGESQEVSLDITGILSAWVKGKPDYGLIIKSLIEKGGNFTILEDLELPLGGWAKLEVYYTAQEVMK